MKAYKITFWLVSLTVSLLLLLACAEKGERKIKMADRPVTALMQDEVETIELAASQKKKVALIEFQNRTANAGASWLSSGINQKLSRELAQSQQLNLNPTIFVQDVFDSLGMSPDDLVNERASSTLAQKVNADVLVRGDYYFEQNKLHINMELRQADGTILKQFARESQVADTLAALNSIVGLMADDIRRELEVQSKGVPEVDGSYASASTTSLEALKLYLKANEKVDQFYIQDAVPLLEKAIHLDTTFASAYLLYGQTLLDLGLVDEARTMFVKARQYSASLSDRERIPIEATTALLDGEYYKAIKLYNHFVELYPEDANAHYQLGQYYFSRAHNYPKAIEKYETTIELNPKFKIAYNQLAYSYAYIGKLDNAFHILDKYAELAPNEPNPIDSYAELLQREGHLKEAVAKYKKALAMDPHFWHSRIHLAIAYQDLGHIKKAGRMLRDVAKDSLYKKYRDNTINYLAYNAIVAGRLDKAEDYLRDALKENPKSRNFKMSLLYIRPDSPEYQKYFIDEIEHQVELAQKDSLKYEMLLGIVSMSLYYDLGLDLTDKLLDKAIESTTDPILFQAAFAYKTILDFRFGRRTTETEEVRSRGMHPESFEYASPVSWNDYWRHYFDALRIASENGIPVHMWVEGFHQFAQASGNQHFEINSDISVAAAEFLSGDKSTAKSMLNDIGIPCEESWKFIGPFNMTKGFHQKFWPEKIDVEKWATSKKFAKGTFQTRDDLFDGYVNLKEITSFSTNKAVYAILEINSKGYKVAQLRFGMSGRLKVWLNGESVMTKNVRGDAVIDRYIANVKLHLGTNYLLVRVDNAIGELGFYFRMTDTNGEGDRTVDFESPTLMASRETEQAN